MGSYSGVCLEILITPCSRPGSLYSPIREAQQMCAEQLARCLQSSSSCRFAIKWSDKIAREIRDHLVGLLISARGMVGLGDKSYMRRIEFKGFSS